MVEGRSRGRIDQAKSGEILRWARPGPPISNRTLMKRPIAVKANRRGRRDAPTAPDFDGPILAGSSYDGWTGSPKRVGRARIFPEGPTSPVSASSVRELSRLWTGSLSHFRRHRNDEHLEALLAEALRFTGLHLENDLSSSPYWSKAPLGRRVALLLFLVDRGVVNRVARQGRMVYEAREDASAWAIGQPSMVALSGADPRIPRRAPVRPRPTQPPRPPLIRPGSAPNTIRSADPGPSPG